MSSIKYFLYARKSSEDEDRQVQSIPDQVKWLKQKASTLGITVTTKHIFTESKTNPTISGV